MARKEREESEHYGPGTPCSQCGDPIPATAPAWTEYCSRHNPPDELEELLFDAFVDGFMQSGEGGNAEYPFSFDEGRIRESLRKRFDPTDYRTNSESDHE